MYFFLNKSFWIVNTGGKVKCIWIVLPQVKFYSSWCQQKILVIFSASVNTWLFPFFFFWFFLFIFFLHSRCGFWDFRSLRFHFTKHTENLSSSLSLKNAFDLCVIISIVLERFMKIMTGSCAHWYSDMSSLLVTWTICHFTKLLSIIQSNYNSFSDYAIFTRLFYDSLWQARVRLFCGSIYLFFYYR